MARSEAGSSTTRNGRWGRRPTRHGNGPGSRSAILRGIASVSEQTRPRLGDFGAPTRAGGYYTAELSTPSRSAVVRPSARRPASASPLRDPVADRLADGSNSFVPPACDRLEPADRVRRNSGAYGATLPCHRGLQNSKHSGVHKTGSTSKDGTSVLSGRVGLGVVGSRLRSLVLFDLLELAGRCTVLVVAIFLGARGRRIAPRNVPHLRPSTRAGLAGDDALQDLNEDSVGQPISAGEGLLAGEGATESANLDTSGAPTRAPTSRALTSRRRAHPRSD